MATATVRANVMPLVATDSRAIVDLLRRPATHPDRPKTVECIETHISWVFLSRQFAYKLKKPVKFDFLDFSTPELRRQACEAEVRLNRRLARHVYLGVEPIVRQDGRRPVLALSGNGTPVDWVVKMRRLPAERALDQLIRAGQISADEVRQIGLVLSTFFRHSPPLVLQSEVHRHRLLDHILANVAELANREHGLDASVVRRVHEAQRRLALLAPDVFDDRVRDGRIVDGHGDLRPEHIYLVPHPTIIDCVEFSADLRQLDVLDELCFLAMECARLGAAWIGDQILAHYEEASGDHPPPMLVAFYKMYRACVRAKVATLRASQLTGDERQNALSTAGDYLAAADNYSREMGSPFVVVVRGLTGTGKSTIARRLGDLFEVEVLETDAIRRELFGASVSPAGYEQGNYEPSKRAGVYIELLRRARLLLEERRSVVLDGTFVAAEYRMSAARLAAETGAALLIVDCRCPAAVARSRIAARLLEGGSRSESRPDVHGLQMKAEEPDPPGLPVCHVDTTASLPTITNLVLARLRAVWASRL
jgi:aminoglycoside phosphotransferase family enzyme/predicted kinase